MASLRLLYRDYDRAPYLYTLKHAAALRGLELVIEKAPLGGRYPEFLVEGATDLLAENYWGLQSLAFNGTPIVSLVTAVTWLNETLFVHPDIDRVSDLRGRKFAIRGTGPSELIPGLWLQDNGLGEDVTPVIYSEKDVGRWGQWRQVVSGACHGTFVTNFYQNEPRNAGLKEMPIGRYGFIGNVTLSTLEPTIAARKDDIQTLVEAAFDATYLFINDPEAALAICRGEPMRLLEFSADADTVKLYHILRSELSAYPIPSAEGISNTRRMRLPRNPELADFNPLAMWDLSFARSALRTRLG